MLTDLLEALVWWFSASLVTALGAAVLIRRARVRSVQERRRERAERIARVVEGPTR